MNIILASREPRLTAAWSKYCSDLDFVAIHEGSILDLVCDAVVSPSNSFGFMDGGIDAMYSERFGWHVQDRLRQIIAERHNGELLVGCAEIVETDYVRIRHLIAAPTMRIPTVLEPQTVNPYLASRAVFLLIQEGIFLEGQLEGQKISEHVGKVAFPGMGTGIGRVSPELCAKQVRAAIDEIVLGKHQFPPTWTKIKEHFEMLSSLH